jgi:hypothetical protein
LRGSPGRRPRPAPEQSPSRVKERDMAEARPGRMGKATSRKPPAKPSAGVPPPVCQVAFCPICTAVTALREVRPDLMEHLLVAGREMLLAFRAVIDARLEGKDQPARLERLTIE